mmetsp:Transcript_24543/g.24141  ORF Transcript_24543/g.24141 Transcript_24543/m.24141 type:complete len:203 (-) Transcript_24543:340-948(-)
MSLIVDGLDLLDAVELLGDSSIEVFRFFLSSTTLPALVVLIKVGSFQHLIHLPHDLSLRELAFRLSPDDIFVRVQGLVGGKVLVIDVDVAILKDHQEPGGGSQPGCRLDPLHQLHLLALLESRILLRVQYLDLCLPFQHRIEQKDVPLHRPYQHLHLLILFIHQLLHLELCLLVRCLSLHLHLDVHWSSAYVLAEAEGGRGQ